MAHFMNNRRRLGALGAALLAVGVSACTSIDGVTAPERDAVAAKPVAQTPVSARSPAGPTNVSARVTLLAAGSAGTIVTAGDNLGDYIDGKCGVTATLLYAGSNDMIMNTGTSNAGDRKCSGQPAGSYPRKIRVILNDVPYSGTGVNLLNAGSISFGGTANRQVGLPLAAGAPCIRIQFNLVDGGLPVSRSSDGLTYSVSGSASARCVQSDGSYTMLGTLAVSLTARQN